MKIKLFILLLLATASVNAQNCGHIQVFTAPYRTSDPNYADFNQYVLNQPDISGVSLIIPWDTLESKNIPGHYHFALLDSELMHFTAAGKLVNLIIAPAEEGGINHYTPTYVFSAAWADSVGAPNPQDVSYCGFYPGATGNVTDTVLNITSPLFDNTGMPVSYELPIKTAYKNFIAAVIQHYSQQSPTIPVIGYIRFGMCAGGEIYPGCFQEWPGNSVVGAFETKLLAYDKEMMSFIATQNPQMRILADINRIGVNNSYPDSEADYAVNFGNMGFGTNGLRISDTTNFPDSTTSDWGKMFAQYRHTAFNGDSITLSLQTVAVSDPTNASNGTGSWVDLAPFVKENGANNLEVYLCDILLAYDPHYSTAHGCDSSYASYALAYANAFAGYVEGCTSNTAVNNINAQQNKISLYPNPTTNTINLSFGTTGNAKAAVIKITDVPGKEMISENITISNSSPITIDVSAFAPGMYFAKMMTHNGTQVLKFIKQ